MERAHQRRLRQPSVFAVLLISVVSVDLATPALARAEVAVEPTNIKLEELSIEDLLNLNVDVFVATKRLQRSFESPSSVTVFTGEDIRAMGITSLDELLNYVPGFTVTRDVTQGRGARIAVRGRASPLGEYVLFLLNGQRMNDVDTGGPALVNRLLPVENIKQVEVIRGTGSALYGSNAFFGVVNIITDEHSTYATARAGSRYDREASLNVASDLGPLHGSVFVKGFSDEGQLFPDVMGGDGVPVSIRDPQQGFDGAASLSYRGATLRLRHMRREFQDFMPFGALQRYSSFDQSEQSMISLSYQRKLSDALSLDAVAAYSNELQRSVSLILRRGTELAPEFSLPEPVFGGPLLRSYNAKVGLDVRWDPAEKTQLLIGAALERMGITDVANLFSYDLLGGAPYENVEELRGDLAFNQVGDRLVFGAYVQARQLVGDWLQLTVGGRLDAYDDFGVSFNPRAAAVFIPPHLGSTIKVIYGKAFRAPSFLEFHDQMNPATYGNPDLKPENVHTFELSWSQEFAKRFAGTLTFHQERITDSIVPGPPVDAPNNPYGAPGFVNDPSLFIGNGLEVELAFTPFTGAKLRGAYSHLFQLRTPSTNPDTASLIATYEVGPVQLVAHGTFRAQAPAFPAQGDYLLLNAGVAYRITGPLKVRLDVANLLDTSYLSWADVRGELGVPERGRTILLGLVYEGGQR